jgi:hypothetical protein
VVTTHALFARKVRAQTEQCCCWFCRWRIIFGSAEIAANLRVISAMQIDDQRVREDARRMLAPGPSCVFPLPQLKREWSLWPEFGWSPGNLRDLSKG